MKTEKFSAWTTAALIIAVLSISPLVSATEKGEKEDLNPKIIVRVDGLTCPF